MVKTIALKEHALRGVRAEPDAKIARHQARGAIGTCSAGPLICAIAAPALPGRRSPPAVHSMRRRKPPFHRQRGAGF